MTTMDAAAKLVEQMAAEKPWADQPWARVALAVAARTIRRGRHLTEAEKLENLAKSMEEADDENGTEDNARIADVVRRMASAARQ